MQRFDALVRLSQNHSAGRIGVGVVGCQRLDEQIKILEFAASVR